MALAAEGGRRTTTTASNIAELAINNREKWRDHSRFGGDILGDDDEDKHRHRQVYGDGEHRHVYGEQGSVVNKGYVRGQSVIVGGGDRSYANRIGFRRSASFHAAGLFEEIGLAGMETTPGGFNFDLRLYNNDIKISEFRKTIWQCK